VRGFPTTPAKGRDIPALSSYRGESAVFARRRLTIQRLLTVHRICLNNSVIAQQRKLSTASPARLPISALAILKTVSSAPKRPAVGRHRRSRNPGQKPPDWKECSWIALVDAEVNRKPKLSTGEAAIERPTGSACLNVKTIRGSPGATRRVSSRAADQVFHPEHGEAEP
jgi:hypothetical protein